MIGVPTGRRRQAAAAVAIALMGALPAIGFFLAPSAHADDTPGANLAGINATSYATAVQVQPLTPGVVGAGNVGEGNLVEADLPYATSSTSTGPSNSSVASPAYPGDTAAGAGNAIATFSPQVPAALVNALNYPVVARADYPAQVSVGSSGTYAPPGPSGTGIGTASADATPSGSTAQAATSQTTFASTGVSVGSSTASSQTVVGASSVKATSHSDVGTVVIGGAIKIAGITSDATATSDGNLGEEVDHFALGSVTVAGVPASIGPDGITLATNNQGSVLVLAANQALAALKQAGISVRTISPVSTLDGASATVTSGALVVQFQDANIPNPNGQVPISSLGLNLNLGLSQATANATALPPFTPFGSFNPAPGPSASVGSGSVSSVLTGGSTPAAGPTVSGGTPAASSPSVAGLGPTQTGGTNPNNSSSTVVAPPATLLGAPIKAAWVVIAFLLSLVAAGPLLSYANWQLLRGRKT